MLLNIKFKFKTKNLLSSFFKHYLKYQDLKICKNRHFFESKFFFVSFLETLVTCFKF